MVGDRGQTSKAAGAGARCGNNTMGSRGLRSRTGCWTCRGRSVKCDEQRPVCRKCEKANLTCSYGVRLTWIEDSQARGVCHGREGAAVRNKRRTGGRGPGKPSSTSGSSQMQPGVEGEAGSSRNAPRRFFLHTTCRDLSLYQQETQSLSTRPWRAQGKARATGGEGWDLWAAWDAWDALVTEAHDEEEDSTDGVPVWPVYSGLSAQWAAMFGPVSATEAYLLDFYAAAVCRKATMLDEREHNPFRYVLLPMAVASKRVYHGVLAVAASKLAATGRRSCGALALMYRQHALAGLRQLLATLTTRPQDLVDALASAMLLCWFEIADYCRPSWTDHLAAMAALLEACARHPAMPPGSQGLLRFARQYFVYHLVIAKTTVPVQAVAGAAAGVAAGAVASTVAGPLPPPLHHLDAHARDCIQPHQGFSNALLLLIDEISELRRVDNDDDDEKDEALVAARVTCIAHRLHHLRQVPPPLPTGEGPDRQQRAHLAAAAEAHRFGALLFLDETCALRWPAATPVTTSTETSETRAQLVDAVIAHTQRGFDDVTTITAAYPVWALFMAGCAACSDAQRASILGLFAQLETTVFRSYPPARQVIEMVWRQQDLTADENPRLAASRAGSFRTWKAAAGHLAEHGVVDVPETEPSSRHGAAATLSRVQRAAGAQFAWERAMSMNGVWRLILT